MKEFLWMSSTWRIRCSSYLVSRHFWIKKKKSKHQSKTRSEVECRWLAAHKQQKRKERKNQINWNWVYRDVHSMPRFLRALSLSSSCKSHTIASLALFKNFRLFLSLKKLWNSPIARAHSRGRIMFPALRQERKLFFWQSSTFSPSLYSRLRSDSTRGDVIKPVSRRLQSASLLSTRQKKNVKSRSRPANNLWAIDRALHRGAANATQQHVCIETLSVKSFFFSYFLLFNQLFNSCTLVSGLMSPLQLIVCTLRYCVVHSCQVKRALT